MPTASTGNRFAKRHGVAAGLLLASLGAASPASAAALDFQLLTWTDADIEQPSAVGRKPAAPYAQDWEGHDWLVFTDDDQALAANYNPAGALSHNFADLFGEDDARFSMAPSLTGSLTLQLDPGGPDGWQVTVTGLAYQGQATPVMAMNQFLVKPGDSATLDSVYNVDGSGNTGTWSGSATDHWAIEYDLDFYFATSADGDPAANDIDLTFSDKRQAGSLIPVAALNSSDLAGLPARGFYDGDFARYLLAEIEPRLPDNATYLLVTQMDKTNPDYAKPGLPITTAGKVGNLTIAYTTDTIPEPTALAVLAAGAISLTLRRRATLKKASEDR